jgi:hypothetical protein
VIPRLSGGDDVEDRGGNADGSDYIIYTYQLAMMSSSSKMSKAK